MRMTRMEKVGLEDGPKILHPTGKRLPIGKALLIRAIRIARGFPFPA